MIFNTHSHLNDKQEYQEYLQRCLDNGVFDIALVGYDLLSSKRALELSKKNSHFHAMCGIQPEEIDSFNGEYDQIIEMVKDPCCIALGEIGLDYHYGKESKERQLEIFEKQLQIACDLKKPVAIHCRDAYEDTFNLLNKYHDKLDGIIMHCYSGSVEMMERFVKIGCYISFSGVLTFKNAKEIKDVAINVPKDKILVETDDPYLAPVPFRGTENEPAYVIYVVKELSELLNIDYETMCNITTNNAKRVFHL